MYVSEKCRSIDEELLFWKGRLPFKQYIPKKSLCLGIKLFSLCDSTGYLWNLYVYLGKNAITKDTNKISEKELGKSAVVVPKLLFELLDQGYYLPVDIWYTSKKLFNYLYKNDTMACGTARSNWMKIPNFFKNESLAWHWQCISCLLPYYNKYIANVDKSGAMISNYSWVCKMWKWTTKIFMHYLEEAIFNSFIFYWEDYCNLS